MSEQRLRDLLRQAVPEAPKLDPAVIGRRAERERRSRSAALAGAAAVLVVAGTLAVAGLSGDDGPRPRPGDVATQPSSTDGPDRTPDGSGGESPYDVEPCPARLPDLDGADRSVTGLDDVVAVRQCPDLNPRGDPSWAPTLDQLAQLEDADALVHDLDAFVAALRGLPRGLAEYCATDEGPYVGQSLAFYRADGSRLLMAAPPCELVTIEGRRVDGGSLRAVYFDALDRQRDELTYSRPFDDELACDTEERGGPVRPGREVIVAAVLCDLPPGVESLPVNLEPIPLDPAQLAELDRAWARPGDPIVRGPSGEHECLDLEEPPSFIQAVTDRSDIVQLIDSPCGFLVWHGGEVSNGATFPTTVAELGLE